jgi:hypothetical protein
VGTQVGLRETLIATALEMLEAQSEEPSLRAVARAAGVSSHGPLSALPRQDRLAGRRCRSWLRDPRSSLTIADDLPDAREALLAQGMA